MRRFSMVRLSAAVLLVGMTVTSIAHADEPKKNDQKPEALPPPKQVTPDEVIIIPAGPQPGTREIWQYYAVDNRGRFLPRVVYTPSVSFYLRNGEIYPWTTLRPRLFMPYVVD